MSRITPGLRTSEEAQGYRKAMMARMEREEVYEFCKNTVSRGGAGQPLFPNSPEAYRLREYRENLAVLRAEEEMWRNLLSARCFFRGDHHTTTPTYGGEIPGFDEREWRKG